MSESLIATILVVFVLTICLLYIIFMIGFYYGKHTIDHEFHSELMMLRNKKLDNSKKISDEDLESIINRINKIEKKIDKLLIRYLYL